MSAVVSAASKARPLAKLLEASIPLRWVRERHCAAFFGMAGHVAALAEWPARVGRNVARRRLSDHQKDPDTSILDQDTCVVIGHALERRIAQD